MKCMYNTWNKFSNFCTLYILCQFSFTVKVTVTEIFLILNNLKISRFETAYKVRIQYKNCVQVRVLHIKLELLISSHFKSVKQFFHSVDFTPFNPVGVVSNSIFFLLHFYWPCNCKWSKHKLQMEIVFPFNIICCSIQSYVFVSRVFWIFTLKARLTVWHMSIGPGYKYNSNTE